MEEQGQERDFPAVAFSSAELLWQTSTQHLADSDPQALAIRAKENFIRSLLCHTVSAFPSGAQWLNHACIFWVPKIFLATQKSASALGQGFCLAVERPHLQCCLGRKEGKERECSVEAKEAEKDKH